MGKEPGRIGMACNVAEAARIGESLGVPFPSLNPVVVEEEGVEGRIEAVLALEVPSSEASLVLVDWTVPSLAGQFDAAQAVACTVPFEIQYLPIQAELAAPIVIGHSAARRLGDTVGEEIGASSSANWRCAVDPAYAGLAHTTDLKTEQPHPKTASVPCR
jgi:hypothetical protein